MNRWYGKKIYLAVAIIFLIVTTSQTMFSLPIDTYARHSVLAEGNWTKISVTETGLHFIPASTLKKWGYTDVTKVKIHGYGGKIIPDILSQDTFIDDLPQLQTIITPSGIYFYGEGAVTLNNSISGIRKPVQNPYTDRGFYFITENDSPARQISKTGTPEAKNPETTFLESIIHEQELVSPGETGHFLVGEDFRFNKSHTFQFPITECADGEINVETGFFCRSTSSPTSLSFAANSTPLSEEKNDIIPASPAGDQHTFGRYATIRKQFNTTDSKLKLTITHNAPAILAAANLDYISVNYRRNLKLENGYLYFLTSAPELRLEGVSEKTIIWDCTDPLDIRQVNFKFENGSALWTSSYGNERTYIALNLTNKYPLPKREKEVTHSDIHGETSLPDMIIFAPRQWYSQAEKLAALHRREPDAMNVIVLDPEAVYNEFSSGAASAHAFRKTLKMFHDRGNAAGQPLRFVIFMGRTLFDNRRATPTGKAITYPLLPGWQTTTGLNDNDSFTTDDWFTFLDDGSGANIAGDKMSIAVGRIAATTPSEARNIVDKIYAYVDNPPSGQWKNRILMVADDENYNAHLNQSETMIERFRETSFGRNLDIKKLYLDSYEKTGGEYPDARTDMFRTLEEGVVWWNFIGHANPTSWTSDGLMNYTDVNTLFLKKQPVVFAATCDFLRWDAPEFSGAELMFKNRDGGVIAAISATRPVLISENAYFAESLARYIFSLSDKGTAPLTIGEAIQRAKNNYTVNGRRVANSNKLRFVLLGDPALHIALPNLTAAITSINSADPSSTDNPPIVKGSQDAVFSGVITDSSGNRMSDFNGSILSVVYDAEESVETHGNGPSGRETVFERTGPRLFAGNDTVINGMFTIHASMPGDIADNYRPAAISLYARGRSNSDEAAGFDNRFYICGYDENAGTDTVPPEINQFYLNHPSFTDGSKVNESPVVIAQITDNRAVNISSAGIGRRMTLRLDNGSRIFNDISSFYIPSSEMNGGNVTYQVNDLTPGYHTLTLTVWDTAGNYSEKTINFVVEPGMGIEIFDIYSDASPATTEANFFITHNRPDALLDIALEIYDLLGRCVWTDRRSSRSDLFTSAPLRWDLRDRSGKRVDRGIYLYRATLTNTDGKTTRSKTKKIAVASE